ncbi:19.0 kDa class II heat shock protein-like [Ananas comosus]|uniref:17.9 kDa class II heat shock protein n=1 Tax=Ananas comosus TaxID=4615 RepID=A0A199UH81_ANACO|nr:19.0 kDa class II heat shock protein-like [Ananas comosus]XP_020087910.1 19.0 kDa class II heat shock protein-like [Ananas comosus]OAY64066.1 17.9 kDa class II heat shock protein [Ananas comosus]
MEVMMGFEDPMLFSTLQQLMDIPEEVEKAFNAPTRAYVRDRKAMANTPMDVKELPSGKLVLTVDMPGVNPSDVKVQVEEGNVLVISGERRREKEEKGAAEGEEKDKDKEKEGGKYLRMERRMGKFMRKFPLPQNANLDSISASYKDGVLTVTVERMPPPEPKKPKSIEVKVN